MPKRTGATPSPSARLRPDRTIDGSPCHGPSRRQAVRAVVVTGVSARLRGASLFPPLNGPSRKGPYRVCGVSTTTTTRTTPRPSPIQHARSAPHGRCGPPAPRSRPRHIRGCDPPLAHRRVRSRPCPLTGCDHALGRSELAVQVPHSRPAVRLRHASPGGRDGRRHALRPEGAACPAYRPRSCDNRRARSARSCGVIASIRSASAAAAAACTCATRAAGASSAVRSARAS